MQNETHYTSKVRNSNGVVLVLRKSGNVRVATIVKLHRGWEVDLGAGVRRAFDRQIDCFIAAVNNDNNR